MIYPFLPLSFLKTCEMKHMTCELDSSKTWPLSWRPSVVSKMASRLWCRSPVTCRGNVEGLLMKSWLNSFRNFVRLFLKSSVAGEYCWRNELCLYGVHFLVQPRMSGVKWITSTSPPHQTCTMPCPSRYSSGPVTVILWKLLWRTGAVITGKVKFSLHCQWLNILRKLLLETFLVKWSCTYVFTIWSFLRIELMRLHLIRESISPETSRSTYVAERWKVPGWPRKIPPSIWPRRRRRRRRLTSIQRLRISPRWVIKQKTRT